MAADEVPRLTARDLAVSVFVIETRPRVPVYHSLGDGVWDVELKRMTWWTGCGHSVGFFDAWLPLRLVVGSCRPCKKCYPRRRQPVTTYSEMALLAEPAR